MTWTTIRSTVLSSLAVLALLGAAQPLTAGDLSGKWDFTWNTEGGVRNSTIELVQEGDKLSGKFGDADLAGVAKADGFELEGQFHSPEAGYAAALTISGKQEGDKLVGKGQWDSHGMSFTAVRAK